MLALALALVVVGWGAVLFVLGVVLGALVTEPVSAPGS